MKIDAKNPFASLAAKGGGVASALAGGFEAKLQDAVTKKNAEALQASRDLVGVALLSPLMKMARQDPFKVERFHGGQAEEAFGEQLDNEVVKQMVGKMNLPVVDAIYRKFKTEPKGQPKAPTAAGVIRHG
jgi:hypothetical protein